MPSEFEAVAGSWLLTYALHSTLLLGLVWLLTRRLGVSAARRDVLWKAGMVGGLLYRRGYLRLPNPKWGGPAFLLASGLMLALAYFKNPITAHAGGGVLAPLYLIIIVFLAQDNGPIAKALSWKPLEFLGEMSYAVYLLQAPVYIALEPIAQRSGARGLFDGWLHIYLIVLLLLSAAIYQWFERPMRNLLRPKAAK